MSHVVPRNNSLVTTLVSLFVSCSRDHRDLHSFPTRRSSDLRQNTKDQVYAQNEMLAYQQKESTARVDKQASHFVHRSEERFSRNAETDLVCRLLLEKKKSKKRAAGRLSTHDGADPPSRFDTG